MNIFTNCLNTKRRGNNSNCLCFCRYPHYDLDSFAYNIPPPLSLTELWEPGTGLAVDLCICSRQLLNEGSMTIIESSI